MKNVYILMLLFCSIILQAQGENDNWYFGNGAGLNFATNPPTAITNSAMNQHEGVASISNASGQLLFYTDGVTIWGRNNIPMPNGSGLTGDFSTIQSAIIVPHPSNTNLFYVFTVPAWDGIATALLSYSVVDMNLNNGTGDIVSTQKNIAVLDENGNSIADNSEAITYTINRNGTGYWVVFPKGNKLYSYPITSSGFINTPVTTILTLSANPVNSLAHIRISPDNTKVAITRNRTAATGADLLRVYNFDNSTGQADTSYEFGCTNCTYYSTEFSPDSNILYTGERNTTTLHIYDLVNNNNRTISRTDVRFGSLQRSKYNDIYIAQGSFNSLTGSSSVMRITNPNDYANSEISPTFINLGSGLSLIGLPQWIHVLKPRECPANITLSAIETNSTFVYKYSNSISTNTNYVINSGSDITFEAGDFIQLSPNTHIREGSVFIADIEECPLASNISARTQAPSSGKYIIEYELQQETDIYPNPLTGDELNIVSDNNNIKEIAIYDMMGKQVLNAKTVNGTVNASNLTSGVYIVKITEEGKTATKKLVVR